MTAFSGSLAMSLNRSIFSCVRRRAWSVFCNGAPQKLPMYTRHTSGVIITLPRDHMSDPYTRMSCWVDTLSALFSTTRTLSAWGFISSMTFLSSSLMSSLCASKRRMIKSARSANHETTLVKSYPLLTRCFSPERMPGVSTSVTDLRTLEGSCDPSKRLRNETPNRSNPRKGRSGWTDRAFPGMVRSSGPLMRTVNLSVVGSGPMRWPGKSRPSKYLMNEVLPTLY
mmetsp:Transcript_24166/g.69468  ORF Transcript_24166/g.69468 Transcript_24166/m.69468 type:complete len:226 (+) Transcript_24166:373-1050(+)